jgi:hypothetical protein
MRFKLIFLFVCSFLLNVHSQEITELPDSVVSTAPKSYELKDAQWEAWKSIEKKWQKEYARILKEQKLKMSCSGCENIYMDAIITIDDTGKMKHYKLLKSNRCSEGFSKGLEIRFMKWFFNYEFPKELFNTKFEVRLGTGLKC